MCLQSRIEDGVYSCEINWFDPEPSFGGRDHASYKEDLHWQRIEDNFDFYRGYHYHKPPTEDQHRRLNEELGWRH